MPATTHYRTTGCKEIVHFFNRINPVSPEAALFLLKNTKYVSIKKGKFIRSPIDQPDMVHFVVKGLIRRFFKDEGEEVTTWINGESNIIGSIRNLDLDDETDEYLQTLEDTLLIEISRKSLETLYEKFYEANIIGRRILEMYYRDAEERAFLCRLPSAEKRYRRFEMTCPGMIGLRRIAQTRLIKWSENAILGCCLLFKLLVFRLYVCQPADVKIKIKPSVTSSLIQMRSNTLK
ncbi:Crp/Fnr family transcriptional regulator [Sphingobacterium luzhongxinii]|uniref:Crp/Fnr family transcriptional regulator n=1 Tax=Sphingobacterium luzhongxinii TaxID=2654181 RepID=UPI0013D9C419|nr:cyclic nucleotide-binding domain-containing protein [Sphingobacterium sp. xlx-73]